MLQLINFSFIISFLIAFSIYEISKHFVLKVYKKIFEHKHFKESRKKKEALKSWLDEVLKRKN
jgi:hypothetical protein